MTNLKADLPVVMCFSGLDPTGGAGIQADIEAIGSMGCHPAPIVTALTVQNTISVLDYQLTNPDILIEQANAILADIPISAIKIGMLGNEVTAKAIYGIIKDNAHIPVILDPVLQSGTGAWLSEESLVRFIREKLLPLCTIVTPNSPEARILVPEADSLVRCAEEILEWGCDNVLITGGHESSPMVVNTLYSVGMEPEDFAVERLPAMYHGSGCTLSSAIAGLIAQKLPIFDAVTESLDYTYQALGAGYQIGSGQLIPNRLFWSKVDENEAD